MIPLCGGNIDTTILGRCLERGLASDGRLCCFVVRVQDTPGGCAKLTALLAALGVRYVYLSIESLKIRDLLCIVLKTFFTRGLGFIQTSTVLT